MPRTAFAAGNSCQCGLGAPLRRKTTAKDAVLAPEAYADSCAVQGHGVCVGCQCRAQHMGELTLHDERAALAPHIGGDAEGGREKYAQHDACGHGRSRYPTCALSRAAL